MALWIVFDEPTSDRHAHPHDPDDLDRCLGLLAAEPEMRPLAGQGGQRVARLGCAHRPVGSHHMATLGRGVPGLEPRHGQRSQAYAFREAVNPTQLAPACVTSNDRRYVHLGGWLGGLIMIVFGHRSRSPFCCDCFRERTRNAIPVQSAAVKISRSAK